MQDDGDTNMTATPEPAAPKQGPRSEPPESGAGDPDKASLVNKAEGWINDPRAPVVLVGAIFFLLFIAVVSR